MRLRETYSIALMAAAVSSGGTGCAHSPPGQQRVATASVALSNAAGAQVGSGEMWQDANNVVHVDVAFEDMPPGSHAIHFHAVGRCDPAGAAPFTTAGAHYNPLGREHGLDNAAGPHGGDAPNFTVGTEGRGRASFTTDRVSLTPGSTTLFDSDGSALVVHAAADDQISQPAGNSGARIACGLVRR